MKCRVCGESFREREVSPGYDEYPYGERSLAVCTHGLCPTCGADDLMPECVCAQCGEEAVEADMNDGFCRFCAEETEQMLEWIRSMLTPAQMRWIAEHPEWLERGDDGC